MNKIRENRRSEHGGAGVKFLLVMVVILLAAHAGFNYVPVAYEGENFKQEMQTAVVNGLAMPGQLKPLETVKARLQRAASDNDLPPDMVLDVKQVGNVIQAHAAYSKKVGLLPFGIYTYTYQFDHVAVPTGFLLKDSK
jgi:hypothetical protein